MFYNYQEEQEQEQEELLDKFQVERYKQQDKKANREIETDSYITAERLKEVYGSSCGNCGDCLTYTIKDDTVESNLSAQRLNNEAASQLDNIIPSCKFCTCALSNT